MALLKLCSPRFELLRIRAFISFVAIVPPGHGAGSFLRPARASPFLLGLHELAFHLGFPLRLARFERLQTSVQLLESLPRPAGGHLDQRFEGVEDPP